MTGLLDLAPEILVQIVRSVHIYPLQSDAILYKLARTCRRLYQVTEPFLYTKLVQPRRKQTRQLLRTILEKPDYAARVKTISLYLRNDEDRYRYRYHNPIIRRTHRRESDEDRENDEVLARQKEREIELFVGAYEGLGIIETSELSREQWISALKERKEAALVALLLLSLPNIDKVNIVIDSHDGAFFFSRAIIAACSPQQERVHLQHVKDVTMDPERSEDCIRTEELVPIFYLPSLERLSVFQAGLNDFEFEPPLSSCPVASIEFMDSGVASDAAPTLFSVLKHLKHIVFQPGSPKCVGMGDQTEIASIGYSLHLVSATLESLDLSRLGFDESNLKSVPSLHDFLKLKKVSIQLAYIMSSENELWELMPPAIEELHLGTDGCGSLSRDDMVREVMELVLRKEEKFPELKKVVFEGGDENLRDICLTKGIEFA